MKEIESEGEERKDERRGARRWKGIERASLLRRGSVEEKMFDIE